LRLSFDHSASRPAPSSPSFAHASVALYTWPPATAEAQSRPNVFLNASCAFFGTVSSDGFCTTARFAIAP